MKILISLLIALSIYATASGSIRLNHRVNQIAPRQQAQILPHAYQLPPFL